MSDYVIRLLWEAIKENYLNIPTIKEGEPICFLLLFYSLLLSLY